MAINPTKTPFSNMSYTPDVPSSTQAAQEYNAGYNVETDIRGIKSVKGEKYILSSIPGNQLFMSGGFRAVNNNNFSFVVANDAGNWYTVTSNVGGVAFSNIATPTANTYVAGYNIHSTITDSWNGQLVFINDGQNPPMYLLPSESRFRMYDTAPDYYVWNYDVATATANVGNIKVGDTVQAYSSLTAGFMRLYAAPNIGSILVAGNFTATLANTTTLGNIGTTVNYPTQVRWSQNFGLNSGPTTWAPTATNVANQLEVPVRGPLIDGFPQNGNFYLCSYWDTVALSPIAYQSTAAPVFGVKIVNIGRGLLNENCWCNADDVVYGLDARDIWVFNGGSFKSLGNQRVKDWFYNELDNNNLDATTMVNNTEKNQIEIYFPSKNALYNDLGQLISPSSTTNGGYCNRMLSYRYDLDIWNAPRVVLNAVHAVESPTWTGNVAQLATRTVVYSRGALQNSQLVQKDIGTSFLGNTTISSKFERNNINFGQPYSNKVQVHRVLPEVNGTGNITITVGGSDSVGANVLYQDPVNMTINTDSPWVQINQNDSRVVSVKITDISAVNSWETTALNWQITIVEDSR
jgi:hypothetical protein